MNVDLTGNWRGTIYTDGLTQAQGLVNGGGGWGGPPQTYDGGLSVRWQGDYQNFYYVQTLAPFYGELIGMTQDSIAFSGFIDTKGFVKMSLFVDSPETDWTFNGKVISRGGYYQLSGNWTKMFWSNGFFLYQVGNMNVRRKLTFQDRISAVVNALRFRGVGP